MKAIKRLAILVITLTAVAASALAQDGGSVVRRRDTGERAGRDKRQSAGAVVTDRMQNFFGDNGSTITDADRQWMRVIYRSIDLEKDSNAALYFPEEPVEGQENLFRIILRLMADNTLPAYEYLDGREIFTDQYRIKTRDVLDRFHIPYTEAKGSTERNPRFAIDENDVPTNEVLSYYIVERWEFDTRHNRLRPSVEAICPVLHRSGDLRPYLAAQAIFVDDDNNLPTCTYDDFFTLNMYDGEIYKTRNLKNRSMMQMYANPDDLKRAQDSIQARLDNFEKKLWVPSREEVIAAREAREALEAAKEANDSTSESKAVKPAKKEKPAKAARSTKRSTKRSQAKEGKPKQSSSSSNATRSVRRRR